MKKEFLKQKASSNCSHGHKECNCDLLLKIFCRRKQKHCSFSEKVKKCISSTKNLPQNVPVDTYYKVLRTTLGMFRIKAIKRFSQGPKLTKNFPNQKFFPEIAIGHLWCIFVDTAEKILTHCRENLAQYPNLTEKTYLFFPKKVLSLIKFRWTRKMQFDNPARKSSTKYHKLLFKCPRVPKKTFQKNFSSKCIPTFGMRFWRIRMKKFNNGRDMAQCPKMMKKHVFSQFVYTDTQNTFLTTLPKTFGLKLETFFSMYRTGGKNVFFFKTKNIHLQFVPLDA